MVIYPSQDLEPATNSNAVYATPCQVKCILKNPLNDIITYQREVFFTTVQIKFKVISSWINPIVRIYKFDNNAFDWAVSNIHTDISSPNLQCVSCLKYFYVEQYLGSMIFNYCENCTNLIDELHHNLKPDKVNWIQEGF